MIDSLAEFQSTLPRRERLYEEQCEILIKMFQSTLPRRERRANRNSVLTLSGCFNPRSHEGSDGAWSFQPETWTVSIHAPTKGATVYTFAVPCDHGVSIHAPTKGATSFLFAQGSCSGFQSTLPRRERRRKNTRRSCIICFNPRSHEGSDRNFSQKFLPIFSCNQQIIVFYN